MPEPATDQRHDREPPLDLRPAAAAEGWTPEWRARLRERDRAALERFYETYVDRVYGYVRRMLSEDHLAEDVTQDIFLHVQRSLHTYDPSRDPGPWVFTIATNKVRDLWRSRRHKEAQLEASLDDEEPRLQPVSSDRGPLPALENEELGRELARAIDGLPAGMRETLVLRAYEGLSFEEIGRMIGRNETAARKRYSRALVELRGALERYAGAKGGGPA